MQQWQMRALVAGCLALAACAGASGSRGGTAPEGAPGNVRLAPGTPADAIDLLAAADVLNGQTSAILRCYQQRRAEPPATSDAYLNVTLNRDGHVTEVTVRGPEAFEGCARELLSPLQFPVPTVSPVTIIQLLHLYSSEDVASSPVGIALNEQIQANYPGFAACHQAAYPTPPRPQANLNITLTVRPDRQVTDVRTDPPSPMDECVRAVVSGFDLPAHPDGLTQTLSFWLMLR